MAEQMSWEDFKRTQQAEFWGCLDADGHWVDSSETVHQAMVWCSWDHGDQTYDEERIIEAIQEGKYSIVHSSILKQMYEAGLIT